MKKDNSNTWGLLFLLLGLGLHGAFIPIALISGAKAFYGTTIGTLLLFFPSLFIFLGIMFFVFKPEKDFPEED